jgi:hypothetical protein
MVQLEAKDPKKGKMQWAQYCHKHKMLMSKKIV